MSELYHKEGWALKNWCFWTVVLEKAFESPLDCKEIKPVNPKGNQPWRFTGRTDAEAEALIHWHLVWRANLLEKTLMPGKIEGRRRREDREWDGWMASSNEFDGHEFERTPEDGEGQGRLSCCRLWGHSRTQLSDLTTNQGWLQHHTSSFPASLPRSLEIPHPWDHNWVNLPRDSKV